MNYETMELDELKEYAKSLGITFGKIGKDKLIEKIKEHENNKSSIEAVIDDTDLDDKKEEDSKPVEQDTKADSLLDSINSAIDDLEDSTGGEIESIVDLPMDTVINVKSITFGGLTYKSRSTNAIFRWNQIGAVQPMTIAEINEMNNYKTDFLRKPLVILMDERAIKKFRLTPVYENVAKINNLTAVFNSDLATIENVIDDALRVNMRDILISKVRQMYKNKKLVDINIIRLLEDKLSFDLSESE
jgi:hypothetical protein